MKKVASKKRNLKVTNLKKEKVKSVSHLSIDQKIWPLERDIFFRPSRMKYVRKLIKPQGCVFCESAMTQLNSSKNLKVRTLDASIEQSLCVYKSNLSQIVVNKFPYNNGHVLVLPLRHSGEILNLSESEYKDLHDTLKLAIQAVTDLYQPSGFNLGMNHGITGGAGIPEHLHYHVVPRWSGDLNFFPLIAETKLVIEDIATTYQNFLNYFNQMKSNTLIKKTKTEKGRV